MDDNRIKSVVVVGGGTAGWMSAAVLARALGDSVRIRLVESEEIGTVGVGEATIPQIRHINAFLGLDENAFLAATQGTIKLGIEFVDWRAPGESYIHAFGDIGRQLGAVPFHHYWLAGRLKGDDYSLWDYSLNAQAAFAGRFDRAVRRPGGPPEPLTYAFQFDATLYARHLRAHAERLGVVRTEGKILRTTLREPDGFVASVTLESGEVVEGDFFVDCSGFRGLLIEQALKTGYEDWSDLLPCDRAVAVPTANVGPPRPYTQAIAREAGWQWRIPLQHRTGNGHVFCSRFVSEDEAVAQLMASLEGEPLAEPRTLKFLTGRRKRFWNRNVLALGLAGGFMEPLESTSIHLVQSGLSRLLNLFPDKGFAQRDIDEYNRQTALEYERIRDFLVLHYWANQRSEPFWQACREMAIPAELVRKTQLFRTHGRLFREPDDLFLEASWLQVLIGQGVQPESCHPMTGQLSDDQLMGFLADLRKITADGAAALPAHGDFLRQQCAAR
ncbi:MAG: tryptophan 7-halogenase [Caulobacter sp.]|nr:tryptophan 7-halogenase [Caulobacter sp.]